MYNEFVRVSNAWEEATSDSVTTVGLSDPGGPGGPSPSPVFERSVDPISTRGADYAHHIIIAPPDFQTFLRPCAVRSIEEEPRSRKRSDG